MSTLTHVKADGQAHMVDVGAKPDTLREAVARAEVAMGPEASNLANAVTVVDVDSLLRRVYGPRSAADPYAGRRGSITSGR